MMLKNDGEKIVTRQKEGELIMLVTCFLESFFPIVSIFTIQLIGSLFSYAITILIATILFFALLLYRKELYTLKNKEAQSDLLWTTFYITLLFLLIFISLRYTTAGNVAVILFLQLLFSYIYFNLFGSEKIETIHAIGAFIMGVGAIVLLWPKNFDFNIGNLLALIASALGPIANFYQKRAREKVSAITILTYRNIVALPVLFLMAFVFESVPAQEALEKAMPYLLFNAVVIYVIAKIFWIEALRRISITKMSALLAFSPIFTLIFSHYLLSEELGIKQFVCMGIIIFGSFLLVKKV